MLLYRVFISCLGGKNEKYTGCYYSIGIAVNRRCSANVAQTSDEPWEESGSGLGPENSYVISIDTDSVVIPQTVSAEPAIDLSDYKNIVNHSSDIIYGEVESVENLTLMEAPHG